MPRPVSKAELLTVSQDNYEKLIGLVDSLSETNLIREFPEGYLNRNVRDVLAHLHEWHLMMGDWYRVGMRGEKPDIPAPGFTWKTTDELNRVIRDKYEGIPLSTAKEFLKNSHQNMMQIINNHSDEELFEKKKYHWTGSTSLGAYLISATSSHYDWAVKLIRKCLK